MWPRTSAEHGHLAPRVRLRDPEHVVQTNRGPELLEMEIEAAGHARRMGRDCLRLRIIQHQVAVLIQRQRIKVRRQLVVFLLMNNLCRSFRQCLAPLCSSTPWG